MYAAGNIDRIDKYVVTNSINFIEKCIVHFDDRIIDLADPNRSDHNFRYKNVNIFHFLNNKNQLFVDDQLLYFHRGYFDSNKMVYNVNQ